MAIKYKNFDINSEEVEKRAKELGAVKKNTANSSNTIAGVDSSITNKAYNSTFKESENVKNAVSESGTALGNVKDLTSKEQLVSDDTWNSLGKQFSKPNSVIQADSYLNSQLQKIQSGKTSYSDGVRDIISQITGREKFSYDVDQDPLFQQALASAMNSGKTAMQDTIGQASALTGGYGSTYATSAGNQAYNSFIEDAYNNLPQYYQMALDAYNAEGENLLNQYSVLSDADNTEYSRMMSAYDTTYQHRNQMYNEAYQQFRDAKNDAYNIANLKLSEHGQLVNDAYNYFNASADYANTLYEREYNKWADEVNQAMKWAEMLNSDWWSQTQFDEGVGQYEQNFAEEQRQYDTSRNDKNYWAFEEFKENQRQFNANHEMEKNKLGADNYFREQNLKLDRYSMGDTDMDGVISDAEKLAMGEETGDPRIDEIKKIASGKTNQEDRRLYLSQFVYSADGNPTGFISEEEMDAILDFYEQPEAKLTERKWKVVDYGGKNGGGGIDGDARIEDQYGNVYTMDNMFKMLKADGMSKADAMKWITDFQLNYGID